MKTNDPCTSYSTHFFAPRPSPGARRGRPRSAPPGPALPLQIISLTFSLDTRLIMSYTM